MLGPQRRGQDAVPQDGPKKKRSRLGCNTCRARKVKCDERPDGCANCEKLQLDCSGYERPSGTVRKVHSGRRTYRSCNDCRAARCKCSGDRPTCTRCRQNDIRCSYQDSSAITALGASPTRLEASSGVPGSASGMQTAEGGGSSVRDASVSSSAGDASTLPLPWLQKEHLPDPKHIRLLVTYYFQNFHPLRCFAFIHKPTFLRQLDENWTLHTRDNALLYIICTLGAQFFALEHSDTVQKLPDNFILKAGCQWAKTAERLLLGNTDKITIQGLMTAQLLYDYALRMANFPQAFILSALMARMTQALQINLEYSSDLLSHSSETNLTPTIRESRRRLMWSCYVTDVLCGSGVDQLTLIQERDLKIQLPYTDWHFLHERPCITRTLGGPPLDFLPPESIPGDVDNNMGMLAYFVQQVEIRRRVLRYIKHLDQASLPWLPDSEFTHFANELRCWYDSLPASLELTQSNIYTRKESSQLGALCLFHCAYHQTMCDLYRIGTPSLYKLRSAFRFPQEQLPYQRQLQWVLFKSARTLAAVIAQAERHGPRMLGDTWLPTMAYDSNRIMLFYLTEVTTDPVAGVSKRDLVLSTIPYLQSNLKALKQMRATNVVAEGLSGAAEALLEKLGVSSNNILSLPNVILDDPYLALFNGGSGPGTPPQSAPDYVLNPLSIYRMARQEIPERHAPENTSQYQSSARDETSPGNVPKPVHNDTPLMSDRGYQYQSREEGTQPVNLSQEDMFASMEGFGPNLDMFFAPEQIVDWQSSEMVVGSGMEAGGLLPWMGTSQTGDMNFDQFLQ